MNIFFLDESPWRSAELMVDRHVVKMITETNQLLCSVFWLNNIPAPYKLTHKNHPSAIWTRNSKNNFEWLLEHLQALCYEYSYRYEKIHKGESLLNFYFENKNRLNFQKEDFEFPPLAMKEEFKISKDHVLSYRNYYKFGKSHLHKWKKRGVPSWIQ